jgi:hypothetical protein
MLAFHNTFLVYDQQGQAAYLHYLSALSPHPHRSFNNLFVAVNPQPKADITITFVPPPTVPGPTDGNLYHRIGHANTKPFRSLGYTLQNVCYPAAEFATLDELRNSTLFKQSQTQYPPGYEAKSRLADPRFRQISDDGSWHALDDLRLRQRSPARGAGIKLPPDLQELGNALGSPLGANRERSP